jgi:hypothetical protein
LYKHIRRLRTIDEEVEEEYFQSLSLSLFIDTLAQKNHHHLDKPYIHLKQIGAITLNRFLLMLIVLFATTITITIITIIPTTITNISPQLSVAAQDTVQDPSQLSAQITQAQEDIRKELVEQGQIISNAIKEQFGFENIESNLTQAYQYAFTGNSPSAVSQLQSANSALDTSIIALLRSGQELISLSKNNSVILDNNTKLILKDFGESISNLSVAADDIQSQLSQSK